MSKKNLTCIVCPNGCRLEASFQAEPELRVEEITGHLCEKGPRWAEQELTHPVRTVVSSILVEGGDLPLVSVRTDAPIPKNAIFDVMKEIKAATWRAPVSIGQILIENPAGVPCNIVATRNVVPAGT